MPVSSMRGSVVCRDYLMIKMRFAPVVVATLVSLTSHASAVQKSGRDPEVEATVQVALNAAQSGDIKTLRNQYASDCVFVDEFAPFRWSGPKALDAYFASAARMYQETHHGNVKMNVGRPTYIYVAGNQAYISEPLTETATLRGKPYNSAGSLTFTLSRIDHVWKITSQTWVKVSETSNPY
jgi:ketosteroid isomerase-like protein